MDVMRKWILLVVVAIVAFMPSASAVGSGKRVGYPPAKHGPPPSHPVRTTTTSTSTSTSTTTSRPTTTTTVTTTAPTTTLAPLTMTLIATTETLTAAGTYYVTATVKWVNTRPATGLMVCVNNENSGGGSCIGVDATATQYTTTTGLVGEILAGTTLTYRVVACDNACWDSNTITVYVPAAA